MPKQSREQIIAELEVRQIAYREDMSYDELVKLVKTSPTAPMESVKVAPLQPDEPIDYSNVRCGLSTIQDLHRRITLLERAIKKLTNG